jgi:hypothetical protein
VKVPRIWVLDVQKEETALLYGVSYLTDPDYAAWPLKMTLAALNLHVGQQLKHRPDMGKLEALI